MIGYRFHAAPPPSEWLNDPNGLMFDGERFVLFAQHSVAGPAGGGNVGWGRLVSDDLLSWRWDGVAIPSGPSGSAYSGSLVQGPDGLEAFFTRHDPAGPWQTQWRRSLATGAETKVPGPEGRNCRDPFVFRDQRDGCWRMLLAEPCDWTDWQSSRSRLSIWTSPDLQDWRRTGEVGPWHPPGVMWEVPVLVSFGDRQVLILSLVDRRGDRVDCSVRYWVGRLSKDGWATAAAFPGDGLALDYGPDFYAAITNLPDGWPLPGPMLIGWASNWQVARTRRCSGGMRGGPLSQPRMLTLARDRLHQRPLAAAMSLATTRLSFTDRLEVAGLTIVADRDRGLLFLNGGPAQALAWRGPTSICTVFADEDQFELFIEPEHATLTFTHVPVGG